MRDKRAILESVNFGDRVAESEAKKLKDYFVKTEPWRKAIAGDIDIFYGPKGSGKSAIYSLLHENVNQLFQRQILFVAAENPQGATVFRDITRDPPTSEEEFVLLWKLYFLCLAADSCRDFGITNRRIGRVTKQLIEAGLLSDKKTSLSRLFSSAVAYVKRYFRPESVEAGPKIDAATGSITGFSFKVTFGVGTNSTKQLGVESLESLLDETSTGLAEENYHLWLGIDRLDVAFAENDELETNALRALFKTYLDFQSVDRLCPKVFLRTDIWRNITQQGFREASHITRTLTINWTEASLLNLIMRRLLQSDLLCVEYEIDKERVLSELSQQKALFYRIFPEQVDIGAKKPSTFDWMLSRTADGSGDTTPRELIHLLNEMTREQLQNLGIGDDAAPGDRLYSGSAIKASLAPVSRARLEQTLYAEYPSLKPFIEALREHKATQFASTLARIWKVDEQEATRIANSLVDVGFFERSASLEKAEYWVPFLYRDVLELVQGQAK